MATTQFAMVEELASLINDNLHSKHLVLSTEETLIAVPQQQCRLEDNDERSREDDAGTIELQPTGAYHRLLLHCIASLTYTGLLMNLSVKAMWHLVLQRRPETAIPPVLVSDMLWKYDNCDDSTSVMVTRNGTDFRDSWNAEFVQDISVEISHLKADEDLKPLKRAVKVPAASLEEREAAYRAAHECIFSTDDAKGKDTSSTKCRQVPVIAQRMIAHALSKKVQNPRETVTLTEGKGKQLMNGPNITFSSRNYFYPVTPDNREASYVRNGNSNSVGIRINPHVAKGVAQLTVELLVLRG